MLTPEQRQALAAEIAGVPELAALMPDQPGGVAERLNALTRTGVRPRLVTARTVIREIGPAGGVALWKLEAFGNSAGTLTADPQAFALAANVSWGMRFLASEGIDVGDAQARALLDAAATAGVITSAECNALKGLAIQPISRAEELGLPRLTDVMVMEVAGGLA